MMMNYNPMSLKDKIFLVTGAGSGIGAETAVNIYKLGGVALLWDKDSHGLKKTIDRILSIGMDKKVYANEIDLCEDGRVEEILTKWTKSNGKLDGFVHCAGVPSIVPLRMLKKEELNRTININAFAAIELARVFSKKSICNNGTGSIVLVSSVYGASGKGSACNVAYSASKASIIGITKSLAVELASKNIRVNCVVPGFVETAMGKTISGKFDSDHDNKINDLHILGVGFPEDIANGITFLLSNASKWMTGSILTIDGGFSCK